MGLLDRLFGSKKKMYENTLKDASTGVDFVIKGLALHLFSENQFAQDKDNSAPLVVAVVNTVFSNPPSNEIGRLFIQNQHNLKNVKLVIENAIKPKEKLKQIITDAVRVKCILEHAWNPNLSGEEFTRLCSEPIENLKRLGLLIPGGYTPDLNTFPQIAYNFYQECSAGQDSH